MTSHTKMNNENEIKSPKDYTITYRVKLPSNPIISDEKDTEYLFLHTIDKIERGKYFLNLANSNLTNFYTVNNMSLTFFSFIPVIQIYFFRKFRIKSNTKMKSFLKSSLITFVYYYLIIFSLTQINSTNYEKFLRDDLSNNNETIAEFIHFSHEYNKMLS